MRLASYIGLLHTAEQTVATAFRRVGGGHAEEPDVYHLCFYLAAKSDAHVDQLNPVVRRYGQETHDEPERLHATGLDRVRSGPVGLLRDLQDLSMLVSFVETAWTVIGQAAQALDDRELQRIVEACEKDTSRQMSWLSTRLKQAAPQALIAAR